jgi:hypothetical protein
MIIVLMRQQNIIHPHPAFGDPFRDSLGRINEQISIGSFDKVAVRLNETAGVAGDFHISRKAERSRPDRNAKIEAVSTLRAIIENPAGCRSGIAKPHGAFSMRP